MVLGLYLNQKLCLTNFANYRAPRHILPIPTQKVCENVAEIDAKKVSNKELQAIKLAKSIKCKTKLFLWR